MNKRGFSLAELIVATTLFSFLCVCIGKMETDFYLHQARNMHASQRYAGIIALRNFFENRLPAITYVASPPKTAASASMIYGYSNTVWNNINGVYNPNTLPETWAACVSNICPYGVLGPYCAYYYHAPGVASVSSACSYTTGWTFIAGGVTSLNVFSRDNNGPQEVLRMNASFDLGDGSTGTVNSAIQIAAGS